MVMFMTKRSIWSKKMARWKPNNGEYYTFIDQFGKIKTYIWEDDDFDNEQYELGNVFQTYEQAKQALEKLKEQILSLHGENVYSNNKESEGKMSELMCSECKKCDGDRCTYFDNDMDRESTIACILFEPKKPTLFDRITVSPEVLAPQFVYHVTSFLDGLDKPKKIWYSTLIKSRAFASETEAKRATVAKLKEEVDYA